MNNENVKYIYQSHLGGIYVTDHKLDFNTLYCEECGDYDDFLGEARTPEEAWEVLKPLIYFDEDDDENDKEKNNEENNEENNVGVYNILLIMDIIETNFLSENGMYVVLNVTTNDRNGKMYKFTRSEDVEDLPVSYCYSKECIEQVLKELFKYALYYGDEGYVIDWEFNNIEKIITGDEYMYDIYIGNYYMTIKDYEDDTEITSGMRFNQAIYISDGYYGFIGEDELEHDEHVKMGPMCRYIMER